MEKNMQTQQNMHANQRPFQHKKPFQHAKKPEEQKVPIPMTSTNFVDHSSTSHYCQACKLPHNEEGCAVFAQTAYIYAPEQGDESFGRHDDTVNMLSEMDEVKVLKFQISNGKRVSAKNFMHVNSEQFDAYNVDMQRTSRFILGSQMTP
jgi:hypothetical protein